MPHAAAAGIWITATFALVGLIQPPPASQPEEHPRGGHPQVATPAADWPKPKAEDVRSLDSIVNAFYTLPSGDRGQAREWDRYRSLFMPDARMVAARPREDGTAGTANLSIDDYVGANRKYFEKGGFFDREVGRRVETFGNIAHVWSTYESRHQADAPDPYIRGIYSLQLLKDGERWWIVNVYWDFERPDCPIPEKYLQKAAE